MSARTWVSREFRPLVEAAEKAGWTPEQTRRHVRLVPPKGAKARSGEPAQVVVLSSTSSDHRAMQNARGDLRRQGIDC